MTKLSVNVNKFATLRNARGGNNPDVLKAAKDCLRFGADGITVHPRPDERHIKRQDVYDIANEIDHEFNIEGYPSDSFLQLVTAVKPTQCTLVPDPPGILTSNAGWDAIGQASFLQEVIDRLKSSGIRTSLFMETELPQIEQAKKLGADRIELYTEPYAVTYQKDRKKAVKPYIEAAKYASEIGLGINAGHDLSLDNLTFFVRNVPGVLEVSIGHALVCDALYLGLEKTIQAYLECLK